jgi:hypothetical protein
LFIDIATFGTQAEACARYLRQGRQVGFDGRLTFHQWTAEDGTMRSKYSAIGHVRIDGGIQILEEELSYQLDRKDHQPLAGDERLLDVLANMEERGLIRSMLCFVLTGRGRAELPADHS